MKEKIKVPKCKGVWKNVYENGVWYWKCSKCGKRVKDRSGKPIDHIDRN